MVAVAAILVYRRLGREMKMLAAYFFVALIISAIQYVLAARHMNNLWTIRVFSPIEFVVLMYVFSRWNVRSLAGKIMLYSIPIYLGAMVTGFFFIGSGIFSYLDPIAYIGFILSSSYTLLAVGGGEAQSVLKLPSFWICSAATIYFGSTIVLLSLNSALLNTSRSVWFIAWSVQAVMNTLANLIYAWGFLCLLRKT